MNISFLSNKSTSTIFPNPVIIEAIISKNLLLSVIVLIKFFQINSQFFSCVSQQLIYNFNTFFDSSKWCLMARANAVGAFGYISLQSTKFIKAGQKMASLRPWHFLPLPAFEKIHINFIHLAPIAVVQCWPMYHLSSIFLYLLVQLYSHKNLQILTILCLREISLFPVNTAIWIKFLIHKNNTRPLIL